MQETTVVLGGRYELREKLGEGGMAEVFAATDRELGRRVAVKVLAEPYRRDRGFVERFRREAASSAKLDHPNIAAVYDRGSDDGRAYLVMELVEGETLADRLRRDGPMDAAEAVRIGTVVVRAVGEAHRRGIVHRDVKPGNVMLGADGTVKVVDFGIARALGAQRVTRSGLVLGSAWYLSPEQAQGAAGDPRSDLYGFGCLLHEMLTGRPPFTGDDPVAVLYQHVNESPPSPSSTRWVPADLERIVARCLEKSPERRFASAEELEAALVSASLDGRGDTLPLPGVEAAPTEPIARRGSPSDRRRGWVPVAVVLAVVLVAALAAFGIGPTEVPSFTPAREARQEALATAERALGEGSRVARAYASLVWAIRAGEVAGEVGRRVATELTDRAERVLDAYAAGNADGVTEQAASFRSATGSAVDAGTMSPTVVAAVLERLDALTTAMANEPIEPEDEPPVVEDEDGNQGGNEDGDEDGGPPPHAEAKGHDEDDD